MSSKILEVDNLNLFKSKTVLNKLNSIHNHFTTFIRSKVIILSTFQKTQPRVFKLINTILLISEVNNLKISTFVNYILQQGHCKALLTFTFSSK